MNWRTIPILRILCPYLIGIVMSQALSLPEVKFWWILGILTGLLSIHLLISSRFTFRKSFGLLLPFLFIFLGIFNAQKYYHNPLKFLEGKDIQLLGYCIDDPKKSTHTKQSLRIQKVMFEDQVYEVDANLFLTIKEEKRNIAYGDLLLISTKLKPIKDPTNAFQFNFKQFAKHQRICYQLFVNPKDVKRIDEGHGLKFQNFFRRQRNRSTEIIKSYFPDSTHQGILSALVLGQKNDLSKDTRTQFSESGIIHVLAVSGLHVGIVWSLLQFLLFPLKYLKIVGKQITPILCIIGIWAFALFTGGASPVLRASIIFTFILIGKIFNRDIYIYNLLSLSAFLILWFYPGQLFQLGFQFSFLAVLSILLYFEKFESLFYSSNFILQYAWKIMSVSFAAQVLVFPLSIYYFHQFPTFFFINSLFVIPLAYLLIATNIFILITHQWCPSLNNCIAQFQSLLLDKFEEFILFMNQLPGHLISNLYPQRIFLLFLYSCIIFITIGIIKRKKSWLKIACIPMLGVVVLHVLGMEASKIDHVYLVSHSRNSSVVLNFANHSTILNANLNYPSSKRISDFLQFNHRKTQTEVDLHSTLMCKNPIKRGNTILFNGQRIEFWNEYSNTITQPQKIAVLIIQSNTNINFDTSLLNPNCYIFFDPSNHHSFIKQSQEKLQAMGRQSYSTKNAPGAIIYITKHKALWKKIHSILIKTNVKEFWL